MVLKGICSVVLLPQIQPAWAESPFTYTALACVSVGGNSMDLICMECISQEHTGSWSDDNKKWKSIIVLHFMSSHSEIFDCFPYTEIIYEWKLNPELGSLSRWSKNW